MHHIRLAISTTRLHPVPARQCAGTHKLLSASSSASPSKSEMSACTPCRHDLLRPSNGVATIWALIERGLDGHLAPSAAALQRARDHRNPTEILWRAGSGHKTRFLATAAAPPICREVSRAPVALSRLRCEAPIANQGHGCVRARRELALPTQAVAAPSDQLTVGVETGAPRPKCKTPVCLDLNRHWIPDQTGYGKAGRGNAQTKPTHGSRWSEIPSS